MSRNSASPTQQHLPIAGIQDSVVIMNDGSVRAVIKIEPINFELKSETEQNGIIYGYQAFLNSLDFPIQIVIQSKKLDLENYLHKLDEAHKTMTNDLLRIQTEEYVNFVRQLISVANIMTKRFYLVVSYSAINKTSGLNAFSGLFHKSPTGPLLEQTMFDRYRAEVFNRANLIGGGLNRVGLKVSLLETQQLIELFYSIYNPDIATEERLTDITNLMTGVVTSERVLDGPAGEVVATPEAAAPTTEPTTEIPANPPTQPNI